MVLDTHSQLRFRDVYACSNLLYETRLSSPPFRFMFVPAKDSLNQPTTRRHHPDVTLHFPQSILPSRYGMMKSGRMRGWLLLIPLLLVVNATLRLRTETDLSQTHGVLTSVSVRRAFLRFFSPLTPLHMYHRFFITLTHGCRFRAD